MKIRRAAKADRIDGEVARKAALRARFDDCFLGGSTEWKIARMIEWGQFCAERRVYYHVARVNTISRMSLAIAASAHSVDGSSGSRYAVTVPKLTYASRHQDLFAP